MVETEDMVPILANVPLFRRLNNRQLKQIASRFIPRTFHPDQAILTQGKSGFGMFIIASGRAEAVLELADGSKTVLNEFGPTDFFGEVTMLDGGPRTASVVACEETECLVLDRIQFIALMNNDASMATEIAIELAKRLRRSVSMV